MSSSQPKIFKKIEVKATAKVYECHGCDAVIAPGNPMIKYVIHEYDSVTKKRRTVSRYLSMHMVRMAQKFNVPEKVVELCMCVSESGNLLKKMNDTSHNPAKSLNAGLPQQAGWFRRSFMPYSTLITMEDGVITIAHMIGGKSYIQRRFIASADDHQSGLFMKYIMVPSNMPSPPKKAK